MRGAAPSAFHQQFLDGRLAGVDRAVGDETQARRAVGDPVDRRPDGRTRRIAGGDVFLGVYQPHVELFGEDSVSRFGKFQGTRAPPLVQALPLEKLFAVHVARFESQMEGPHVRELYPGLLGEPNRNLRGVLEEDGPERLHHLRLGEAQQRILGIGGGHRQEVDAVLAGHLVNLGLEQPPQGVAGRPAQALVQPEPLPVLQEQP